MADAPSRTRSVAPVTGVSRAIGQNLADADWQAIVTGCPQNTIEKTAVESSEGGRTVVAFKAQPSNSVRIIDNGSLSANTARFNSAPRAATNHDIAGLPFAGRG